MSTVTSYASPAKLNLFLHITGQRADGYHTLQTVFERIAVQDTLRLQPIDDTSTRIDCSTPLNNFCLQTHQTITDNPLDNLIVKAGIGMLTYIQNTHPTRLRTCYPVKIDLDKVIPMGAGLGGGSSNAATILIALNQLWQLHLSQSELSALALSLGADVPFFVSRYTTAIATGIGEILQPIDSPSRHYLLLTPPCHVSTQTLFGHPQLPRNTPSIDLQHLTEDISSDRVFVKSASAVKPATSSVGQHHYYGNDFEALVREIHPEIDSIFKYAHVLSQHLNNTSLLSDSQSTQSYYQPRLTGSGAALFLPLNPVVIAQQDELINALQDCPCPYFVTATLTNFD